VFAQYDADELYPPELLDRLAKAFKPEDLQLFYQTAVIGRRDLPLAPEPRTGFEMTLLRMIAFRPGGSALSTTAPTERPSVAISNPATRTAALARPAAAAGEWGRILAALELQGAARQLASQCALVGRQGAVVRFALDPRHHLLRTKAQEEKLAQALSQHFGEPVRVEIDVRPVEDETPAQTEQRAAAEELAAAGRAFEQDPTVQALKDRFGATPVPESIRPVR
jgi:DNA polymerase III subunit gamma/tau